MPRCQLCTFSLDQTKKNFAYVLDIWEKETAIKKIWIHSVNEIYNHASGHSVGPICMKFGIVYPCDA